MKMGSPGLPSLDQFDELDPLGKNQEKYDLLTVLSINEERFGRETKVNGMIQMVIEMFLACLKTVMSRKYSLIYA